MINATIQLNGRLGRDPEQRTTASGKRMTTDSDSQHWEADSQGVRVMTDNKPLAVITKNAIDEIRVAWREYKGHRFIDIRVYTDPDTGKDKVPTKRGIALRRTLYPI